MCLDQNRIATPGSADFESGPVIRKPVGTKLIFKPDCDQEIELTVRVVIQVPNLCQKRLLAGAVSGGQIVAGALIAFRIRIFNSVSEWICC